MTAIALILFVAWTLLLLLLMEILRVRLVLLRRVAPDAFRPDNANLSPFMQRLARAHANCIEGLPVFGGLMLLAIANGQTHLTDPLAGMLVAARVLQSTVHLVSAGPTASSARFAAFTVQLAIGVWWAIEMLVSTYVSHAIAT